MQLRSFKYYVGKILTDGNRLQRQTVKGTVLTKNRFTETDIIVIIIALLAVIALPKGVSDSFAGYVITFLGIFVGMFTTIVVTLGDKPKMIPTNLDLLEDKEKARLVKVKNYLIQFIGLTAYSIILGLFLIILLAVVLLVEGTKTDTSKYHLIASLSELSSITLLNFVEYMAIIVHRFLIYYLFLKFLIITMYSIASYFSFVASDYRNTKIKQQEDA